MSFDHWWIGLYIDESGYRRFAGEFEAAAKKAVLSPEAHRALAAWRSRPAEFEEATLVSGSEASDQANTFIWAFNLSGFDELAKQVLLQEGRFSDFTIEDDFFRMEATPRHTPVSIVWHALGYERARLLPGHMGNLLLHPDEIGGAREVVRRTYAGTSPEELIAEATRYCGRSVSQETLRHVIDFLPASLDRAMELQRGFLSLARSQI